MDITSYRLHRQKILTATTTPQRELCRRCLQPGFSCYCELIKPIETPVQFVILIHPKEIAKRIATGRMAHLCLQNSRLISGHDFTHNESVNEILADPHLHCVMLYPGSLSINLSSLPEKSRQLCPPDRKLTIFVIDGTWHTAKKTVSLSQNLRILPRISFTPDQPSRFRVRKQPRAECYSTIEAIHQTLNLLSPTGQNHGHLLEVFGKMVARQIELAHSQTLTPWCDLQVFGD